MVTTTALALAPESHRDNRGRFLPGCAGGPGNPYVRQVAALKGALYDALTSEDIIGIMRRMRDEALAGNVAAARLVLEYSIGKALPGGTASALDSELTAQMSEQRLAERLTADELQTMLLIYRKLEDQE